MSRAPRSRRCAPSATACAPSATACAPRTPDRGRCSRRQRPSLCRTCLGPLPPFRHRSAPDGDRRRSSVTSSSSVAAKLALFGKLFRGRDDVFALRWQSKGGKSGYSPACAHEWDRALCGKPRVKCAECPNRVLIPLTKEVLQDHLTGRCTVGVYPLLPDENLPLPRARLRQSRVAARRLGLPQCLLAVRGGCLRRDITLRRGRACMGLLRRGDPEQPRRGASEAPCSRAQPRFATRSASTPTTGSFPDQDTLPKGGFGNLIALPLQGQPRREGNSVFVDGDLQPPQTSGDCSPRVKRLSALRGRARPRERAGGRRCPRRAHRPR